MESPDVRLVMSDAIWDRLQRLNRQSFSGEHRSEVGAIGVLGENRGPSGTRYLVARMFWPEEDDFKVAGPDQLVFSASYLRRAHVFMRSERLRGLVVFHTHPFQNDRVAFSPYDNLEEPKLYQNLTAIEPGTALVSVVFGQAVLAGRHWTPSSGHAPLESVEVVGETLRSIPANGKLPPTPPSPAQAFDRATSITGAGALARLARMKVGVVGASGTGSLVCELLLRAGCRDLVIIEPDVMKEVNLNRVLHSIPQDVESATPKALLLKRKFEVQHPGVQIQAVQMNALRRDAVALLKSTDILFGCVDAHTPRLLLCQLSTQYLLPYIDVGSEIGATTDGTLATLTSRASYIAPGRWCLQCAGVVSARGLEFEGLTVEERGRKIKQGYSDDLLIDQPAVMDLNMKAAATGTLLLRHILQPFMKMPLPVMILENALTYSAIGVTTARAANEKCPVCASNAAAGYGDCGPILGFDSDFLARIGAI